MKNLLILISVVIFGIFCGRNYDVSFKIQDMCTEFYFNYTKLSGPKYILLEGKADYSGCQNLTGYTKWYGSINIVLNSYLFYGKIGSKIGEEQLFRIINWVKNEENALVHQSKSGIKQDPRLMKITFIMGSKLNLNRIKQLPTVKNIQNKDIFNRFRKRTKNDYDFCFIINGLCTRFEFNIENMFFNFVVKLKGIADYSKCEKKIVDYNDWDGIQNIRTGQFFLFGRIEDRNIDRAVYFQKGSNDVVYQSFNETGSEEFKITTYQKC